jgi:hypothetical protein
MYLQFAVEVALCSMVLTVHRFRCYSLLYLLTRAHNNWIILLLCPCHSLLDSVMYMFCCYNVMFVLAKFNK